MTSKQLSPKKLQGAQRPVGFNNGISAVVSGQTSPCALYNGVSAVVSGQTSPRALQRHFCRCFRTGG
ncbi:hypothetical protein D3C76_183420 [compost metagenome]